MTDTIVSRLFTTIQDRKDADPTTSYVANLHHAGLDKILEKIGEESLELILAAKNYQADGLPEAIVSEMADLWFHSLVLLAHNDLTPQAVFEELNRREGISGIEEKQARSLTHSE